MKSCMRRDSKCSRPSKSVMIAWPIVWKSKSQGRLQINQREYGEPVRTPSQKREDRVRFCTLSNVEKLSCTEMKLWLQRNGCGIPDESSTSRRHSKSMASTIRDHMRTTTPLFSRKS